MGRPALVPEPRPSAELRSTPPGSSRPAGGLGAEADLAVVTGLLHDGPVQALLAARYLADLVALSLPADSSAAQARDRLEDLRHGLREALRESRQLLRWVAPRGAGGNLADALQSLSAPDASGPAVRCAASLLLAPDAAPELVTVAHRWTQAAVRALAGPGPVEQVQVHARREQQVLVVSVRGPGGYASAVTQAALETWTAAAQAVGGRSSWPQATGVGQVVAADEVPVTRMRLRLPCVPDGPGAPAAMAGSREQPA